MALRELIEGDCGGPSPFSTIATHLIQDRGFRDEGITQSNNIVPLESATTADQLVNEFLETKSNLAPQTFRMKDILNEIEQIHDSEQIGVHSPSEHHSDWVSQFSQNATQQFYEDNSDKIWAESLPPLPMPPPPLPPPSTAAAASTSTSHRETNQFGLGESWADDYVEQTLDSDKNYTPDILKTIDDLETIESPKVTYSKFMKFMQQEGDISSEMLQNLQSPIGTLNSKWVQEFAEENPEIESALKSLSKMDTNENKIEDISSGSWVNEFMNNPQGNLNNETYESDFWARYQGEWDKLSNKQVIDSHPWISEYESYYDPFKDYKFSDNNPMKDIKDALEQGKKRLEAGDLPSAVLCFEAAVQQDPENPEAWLYLGKTQAENEQDPLAIAALKKCLELDTSNATALMTLAVSYTNESYQNQACLTLKEWIMKNDKYNKILKFSKAGETIGKTDVSTILFHDVHNEVKDLFIQAARINPTNEIDVDVQSGLGVLFNLSSEYDKAADCFRAALQVSPNDYRLWNRLGATLANGQRSEEAVSAYSRALQLSPGFIRARYNLGISCINLGAYKEAGEHLLTALNQQAAGRGIHGESSSIRAMSETIWSTFRLVISLMHKYHLNDAVDNRDLKKLNEEFDIS